MRRPNDADVAEEGRRSEMPSEGKSIDSLRPSAGAEKADFRDVVSLTECETSNGGARSLWEDDLGKSVFFPTVARGVMLWSAERRLSGEGATPSICGRSKLVRDRRIEC